MPVNAAEDFLHKLGGAKYFSEIDLSNDTDRYRWLNKISPVPEIGLCWSDPCAIKILLKGTREVESYTDDIIVHLGGASTYPV